MGSALLHLELRQLAANHVSREVALGGILVQIELHFLSLFERAKALGLNRAVMNKNGLTRFSLDEPKSLDVIEPNDFSSMHRILDASLLLIF